MLQRVERGGRGEHPAGEQGFFGFARAFVGDLQERGGFRLFFGRALGAGFGQDLQRAELHGLIDRRGESGDAGGHLIHALQHRLGGETGCGGEEQ